MNKPRNKFVFFVLISILFVMIYVCFFGRVNTNVKAKKYCENIVTYLGEDDTSSLKNMFCETIVSQSDFDAKVQEAVDFFDGKSISYDITAIGSKESISRGKQSVLSLSASIQDVKTTAEKTYKIRFNSYLIYKDNKSYEGISEISIESDNGETYVLGDYYKVHNEGK